MSLAEAADLTRTGDIWLFRGHSGADRAIQTFTNSPVNHVGMAVVLDDLPPLMWHAELGRSLSDVWAGQHRRGAQLHDLHDSVQVWAQRYGQRAWLRQLQPEVNREAEDAVLRTIARMDGTPFPTSAGLLARWVTSKRPSARWLAKLRRPGGDAPRPYGTARRPYGTARRRYGTAPGRDSAAPGRYGTAPVVGLVSAAAPPPVPTAEASLETAYCAEIVAMTYQAMGLLPAERSPGWYDPGRFWSGDGLVLLDGSTLGEEIKVNVDPPRPKLTAVPRS